MYKSSFIISGRVKLVLLVQSSPLCEITWVDVDSVDMKEKPIKILEIIDGNK